MDAFVFSGVKKSIPLGCSLLFDIIEKLLKLLSSYAYRLNIIDYNIFWQRFFVGLEYNISQHPFLIPHFVASFSPNAD